MVLDGFGGMGVGVRGLGRYERMVGDCEGTVRDGSNARKRGKCQAGQCLIIVGGNWNGIGKQLERNWK